MSYLMALIALIGVLSLFYFVNYKSKSISRNFPPLTQMDKYEMLKQFMPQPVFEQDDFELDISEEFQEYMEEHSVSLLIDGTTAYWVADNVFYTAQLVEGSIDQESVRPIDTQSMTMAELEKMLMILDTLKEE